MIREMELWKSLEIVKLIKEVEIIQGCLKTTTATSTVNEISKKFKREMRRSCVHNAMKLLTDNMKMVKTETLLDITGTRRNLDQKYYYRTN